MSDITLMPYKEYAEKKALLQPQEQPQWGEELAVAAGGRYHFYDVKTGERVFFLKEASEPAWHEKMMRTTKDYLGIKSLRSDPIELEPIEKRGVGGSKEISAYDIRQEVFGTGAQEEFRRVMGRFFSGFTAGLTDVLAPEQAKKPETMVGTFLGAGAELGGFLLGPYKLARAMTGARMAPTVTGLRGVAQSLTHGAANLGIASGLSSIIPAFMENDNFSSMGREILHGTLMGALIGAIYPLTGAVPTKPLRVAATLAIMDLIRSGKGNWFTFDDVIRGIADGTIDKDFLAEATFGYLMDTYFALKVPSMRKQMESLEQNAMIKEILDLMPDQVERTIVEIGDRKLAPGARPTEQEAKEIKKKAPRAKIPSPRVKRYKSDILSFIIRNGGIRPDAEGEHKRFGVRESRYPRLISKKGFEADEMRERLQEDGWLPEGSTLRDMWDLMDSELQRHHQIKEVTSKKPEKFFPESEEVERGMEELEVTPAKTEAKEPTRVEPQLTAEQAKAEGEPIPTEVIEKSPDVKQNVLEAGATDAMETVKVMGETFEVDIKMPKPDLTFIQDLLHKTGIKDSDPDGITIKTKDLVDIFKYFQFPEDIRRTHPELNPLYELQRSRVVMKAVWDQLYAEATKPYFTLHGEALKRVNKALTDSHLQNKDFDADYLKRLGLNDKEIKGYRAIKDNLNEVRGIITEIMHDFGVPNEVIAEFEKSAENYLPHRWYGKWAILVKDAKGKTVYMDAVNYTERYRARDAFKEAFPGEDFTVMVMERNKIPMEAFQQAPHSAVQKMMDLAVDRAKLDESTRGAMTEALSELYKSKGFGMHFIKKKNVPGWTEDLKKPLAEYFSGFSGYVSKMMFMREVADSIKPINPQRKPNLYRYALDYIKYVTGEQMEFKTAKNVAYFYYLWGNVKSASLNLTQNLVLGWPVLSKYTKWSLPKMLHAMASTATGDLTKGERAFLKSLEDGGYLEPQMAQEISGWVGHPIFRGAEGKVARTVQILDVFRHIEGFNRRAMGIAAYRAGITDVAKAADVIDEAHFHYAKGNRPLLMRGPISPVMVFRSWFLNYLTWMKNQVKTGQLAPAARSLTALVFFGGLSALPFWDVLKKLWVDEFGEDPEMTAWDTFGKEFGTLLMHGAPSAVGVEFSGSVGMGDILPTNLEQLGGVFSDVLWIPGVYEGSRIKRVKKDLRSHDYMRALEDAAPESMRNPMAAMRLYQKGATSRGGRPVMDIITGKPMRYSEREAALKAFGYYPHRFAEQYMMQETIDRVMEGRMSRKQAWADRYNLAKINRDPNEAKRIMAEIQAYNKKMVDKGRPGEQITWPEFRAMLQTRMRPINVPPQYIRPWAREHLQEHFERRD